jgi:hypothetical protein
VIIVIGKCEELEQILKELREQTRLLKIIAQEEAPPQLASTGATVTVLSA